MPVAPPKPTLSPDVLRLIHGHSRMQGMARRALSSDRMVPGIEIAPGLFLTEAIVDWGCPAPLIDTTFARWDEPVAHSRLRQLTTTTMGAETAMLRTFAQWLQPDTVLVSYNGKCYDSPLLKTRYRLARLPDPLSGLGHLDLLHPVRRHWKGVWENCRLATAERELLGVVREDDLPGSEAPAAWLSYLRGGSALNLRRVLAHNSQDLKSLAGVLLHLASLPR